MRANMNRPDMCLRTLARAIVDPWEYSACIPDGAHGTGKFSLKNAEQIATGAGLCAAFALSCSSHLNYSKTDTGSAAVTPTFAGNWTASANNASISALYGRTRLVSAGIRTSFTGQTIADSGSIFLAQMPASVTLGALNGLSLSLLIQKSQYFKIVPARQAASITWRPCDYDDQGAFIENAATGAVGTASIMVRPWLLIVAYGLTTGGNGSLMIEAVTNWEGQFADPTFSPGGQNTVVMEPAVPGWFEKAGNIIRLIPPVIALLSGNSFTNERRSTKLLTRGGPVVEEVD